MKETLFYNETYSAYVSEIPYFAVIGDSEEELKEKLISRAISFINFFQLDLNLNFESVIWQKKFAVKKGEDVLNYVAEEVKKTADNRGYKTMSNVYVQTLFSFKCFIDGTVNETDEYYLRAIEEINKTVEVKGGFMESGFNALEIIEKLPLAEGYKKLFILNSRLTDLAYNVYKEFLSSGIKCDNQFKFE